MLRKFLVSNQQDNDAVYHRSGRAFSFRDRGRGSRINERFLVLVLPDGEPDRAALKLPGYFFEIGRNIHHGQRDVDDGSVEVEYEPKIRTIKEDLAHV
jgi:hypothetical protein